MWFRIVGLSLLNARHALRLGFLFGVLLVQARGSLSSCEHGWRNWILLSNPRHGTVYERVVPELPLTRFEMLGHLREQFNDEHGNLIEFYESQDFNPLPGTPNSSPSDHVRLKRKLRKWAMPSLGKLQYPSPHSHISGNGVYQYAIRQCTGQNERAAEATVMYVGKSTQRECKGLQERHMQHRYDHIGGDILQALIGGNCVYFRALICSDSGTKSDADVMENPYIVAFGSLHHWNRQAGAAENNNPACAPIPGGVNIARGIDAANRDLVTVQNADALMGDPPPCICGAPPQQGQQAAQAVHHGHAPAAHVAQVHHGQAANAAHQGQVQPMQADDD